MCGLFGYLSTDPAADWSVLNHRLVAAQVALQHRGPDDRGVESFSIAQGNDFLPFELSLGHTRLSIIDLSPGGHQPMHSCDGRFIIVFNGEIYNYRELRQELKDLGHRFQTDSDTEVLLAAWAQWGDSGLRRLTGMFAFAVFDQHEQTLTLVRDAFGMKPLFYRLERNALYFASEVPALLALLPVHPDPNYQRAYDYLVWGQYDSSRETFYQGIEHLEPGHVLRIDLQQLAAGRMVEQPSRWWWPSIEERTDLSFDEAAAHLREMFLNNVRLHLRSDVPVGAALSGGVDSSAVVCAMRHLEPDMPIHTFSYVARGSNVDEEQWVDIVNAHVGGIAHKVVVEPHELADDLDDMIRAQGEPFGGTSIYAQYRVFKAAHEAGIVVTLDGQGADEILAGYEGYPDSRLRSMLEQGQVFSAAEFLHAWAQRPSRGYKRALLMLGSAMTPQALRKLARQIIGHNTAPSWLNVQFLQEQAVTLDFPTHSAPSSEAKGRRLVEQLRDTLTGNGLASLLRHGDRNSMHWSIESRVPFLTVEMAEFLLQLPESYLLSSKGETKHIFRAAMRGLVPDAVLDRKDKIGFQTPEADWLRHSNVPVHDWVAATERLPFLHGPQCNAYVDQGLNGGKPFSSGGWRIMNYERWARK